MEDLRYENSRHDASPQEDHRVGHGRDPDAGFNDITKWVDEVADGERAQVDTVETEVQGFGENSVRGLGDIASVADEECFRSEEEV